MSKASKSPARGLSKSRTGMKPESAVAPRRAWIPLATASAATFSLAGCSWLGLKNDQARLTPSPLPPAATAPAALTGQMEQYAQNIDAALNAQEKQKLTKLTQPVPAAGASGHAAVPGTPPAADAGKEAVSHAAVKTASNQSITAETPVIPAALAHEAEPAAVGVSSPETNVPVSASAIVPVNVASSAKAHEAAPPAGAAESAAKPEIPAVEPEVRTTAAMAAMAAAAPAADAAAHVAPAVDAPLDPLLDNLRQRVLIHPQNLQYALALNLLESAESGKPSDTSTLPAIPAADQKLLADITNAFIALTAHPASPTTSLAERAAPLLEMAKSWQAEADLSLPKLVLASRVDSFGVYTPVEPKFETGKRQVVIIYCEVANFTSKKTEEGTYQTKLAQQDTLITDDGLLVWRPNPEDIEDTSRNQRRDFYLVKKLTIPETLAMGKYTLRFSVTDKLSNKVSMLSMPIEITAPATASTK